MTSTVLISWPGLYCIALHKTSRSLHSSKVRGDYKVSLLTMLRPISAVTLRLIFVRKTFSPYSFVLVSILCLDANTSAWPGWRFVICVNADLESDSLLSRHVNQSEE